MTDKELLVAAARAAGIAIDKNGPWVEGRDDWAHATREPWNPLTDDGDALRLAVKLGLTICNEHESAGCVYCTRAEGETFPEVESGKPGDPTGITDEDYVATRRAIVRAAAALDSGHNAGVER